MFRKASDQSPSQEGCAVERRRRATEHAGERRGGARKRVVHCSPVCHYKLLRQDTYCKYVICDCKSCDDSLSSSCCGTALSLLGWSNWGTPSLTRAMRRQSISPLAFSPRPLDAPRPQAAIPARPSPSCSPLLQLTLPFLRQPSLRDGVGRKEEPGQEPPRRLPHRRYWRRRHRRGLSHGGRRRA